MGPALGVRCLVSASLRALVSGKAEVVFHEDAVSPGHDLCKGCWRVECLVSEQVVSEVEPRWLRCHLVALKVAFLPEVLSCSHLNQPIHLAQFNHPPEEQRVSLTCFGRLLCVYGSQNNSLSVIVDLRRVVLCLNSTCPS